MITTFQRTDGSTVTAAEVRAVAARPHSVRCRAWVRQHDDPIDFKAWTEFPVIAATMGMSDIGQPWTINLQTVAPQTLTTATVGGVSTPVIVNDGRDINPWGQWIRVVQEIDTPDSKKPIVVPCGFYRVETVVTRRNVLTITGRDALAALESINDLAPSTLRVVPNKTNVKTLCDRIAGLAWPATVGPWAGIIQWDGSVPGLATKEKQYPDMDARAFLVALMNSQSRVVTADVDGSKIYRSWLRPVFGPTVHASIRAGENLISVEATESRTGMVNRVGVQWDKKVGTTANGATQTTRKMLTNVTIDPHPDSPPVSIDVDSRFGIQSVFTQATDANTELAALAVGKTLLARSLDEGLVLNVSTIPMYGVHPGDLVSIRDASGNTGRGMVRSGTVDLTQTSRWDFEVVAANVLAGRWWGSVKTTNTSNDYGWKTLNAPDIDETCKTVAGWAVWDGCTLSDTSKTQIAVKATKTTFLFSTHASYQSNGERKARASIAIVTPKTDAVEARVGIALNDPSNQPTQRWGAWRKLPAGRRTTLRSDDGKQSTPDWDFGFAITGKFGVWIEVRAAKVGSSFTLGELVVEVPNV